MSLKILFLSDETYTEVANITFPARDTNSRLVIQAKVLSLSAMPALNLCKEKNKDLSMKLILTVGGPMNRV